MGDAPTHSIRANDALAWPYRKGLDIHLPFHHRKSQILELVIGSVELEAVQEGHKLNFRGDIRVKILTPERHGGACYRGFQCALVPCATRPPNASI